MHIVVCAKQVPNTTQVRINPETNTLVREGVESIMNPFDENALEMALQLKERHPGTQVTVLTMGPPQAVDILKEAVGRGADEVMLLCDKAFAGSDTWATSYALSMAIGKLPKPDLVLFGKQAIDGDTAQVGPGVADWLGMPCITCACKIEIAGNRALVERAFEDGYEKLEVALPCALTVLKEANVPRMASLRGKMAAKKLQVAPTTAEMVGADPAKLGLSASPTRVMKIFSPPPKTGGVLWQGEEPAVMAQRLVDLLRERKLI
ncbi:MAG: electron transfer flavoprotein subunit beta/FixA family protein [Kiritimatiellae bacterium]|jgi:electron transfer flavoprotein beta subunit|nr:electron transfer flavoprotein subunit beta/FixA family protein [Kiritimatiellia bacterium]NLD90819.1 electron transfer flavoprotein subunit beta/FixA family protein [Lentisphaerota bacterium]HPC20350.1 electron transfer flavoprotein subunit beta/FixA family protein [Kiritimatiellia bacterium]HQQ60317.1 electron transfer flavoprotein subunit beta/FixA family protein [Kiritimatiellia bacterium]